jgi:peptidoglycan/LPS O-acetylase OafA/YrhL
MSDRDKSLPSSGHIPVLDGIRGLAILLVMLRHFTLGMRAESVVDSAFKSVTSVGWSGVDLFFVLSGFLITGLLLDSKYGPHYFRNFFARRALRIFPLYYAVLAVIFFALPFTPLASLAEYATLRANQVWYWTYGSNVLNAIAGPSATPLTTDHFWSLRHTDSCFDSAGRLLARALSFGARCSFSLPNRARRMSYYLHEWTHFLSAR